MLTQDPLTISSGYLRVLCCGGISLQIWLLYPYWVPVTQPSGKVLHIPPCSDSEQLKKIDKPYLLPFGGRILTMVDSGFCSKAQREQRVNLQLFTIGLQMRVTFLKRKATRWNLDVFLGNLTDSALIQMENSTLGCLDESLKLNMS